MTTGHYKGRLYYLGDAIPGVDPNNDGKIWAVEPDMFEENVAFVIQEVKHYISSLDPKHGDVVEFHFMRDHSPKFGEVWLLTSYGMRLDKTAQLTDCSSRRILIHRGNEPKQSAGCWLVGIKTDTTFVKSTNLRCPRVSESVKTLEKLLREKPDKLTFELEVILR